MTAMHSDIGRSCSTSEWVRIKSFMCLNPKLEWALTLRIHKSEPSPNGRAGFAQKVDPIWNEPVSTGNAGALARYEREARNSYSVMKVEIERAAHSVRARAPALPVFASLPATPLFGQGRADDSVYCRSG